MMQVSEKDRWLIEQNFYNKVYSPDGHPSEEYPCSEWNPDTLSNRYYKIVPFPVSDSEYEAMRRETEEKAAKQPTPAQPEHNVTARVLYAFGWIVILAGFIFGLVLGIESDTIGSYYNKKVEISADFTVILPIWLESLVGGCLMIGVSEIIKLLHNKKDK